MGINTPFFHNLTDVVREELASSSVAPVASTGRRRAGSSEKYLLSNAAESGSNLAMFQITGELPLEVDLVFTGNLDSQDARVSTSEMCGKYACEEAHTLHPAHPEAKLCIKPASKSEPVLLLWLV